MKIVYCIPSTYNSGGMERVLSVKANYLVEQFGYEVCIITTSQNHRSSFYEYSDKITFYDLSIDYEAIKTMPLIKRIRARVTAKKEHRKKLTDLLMRIKPDITISMFTHEMSFLPRIHDGSRKILELHFSKNYRDLDAKSNNAPFFLRGLNKVLDILDRRYIKEYDKFVVLTNRDAKDWGNRIYNMEVVPNPLCIESESITDHSAKRVLAVGRLSAQKGFDTLIKAWALVPQSLKEEWHLDIIGSGPYGNKLKRMISDLGLKKSISILPPVKDVELQYLSHSIFCFPSRYEGFGLALMEAMSFGLVPISYDCPCGPSEMITDGENGLLIREQDNSSMYAAGLTEIMQDEELRTKLGKRGALDILRTFSLPVIMKRWERIFNNLEVSN